MGAADRAVDKVLHAGRRRGVGDRLALPHLAVVAGLPEVLHGEDAVGALERPVYGGAVVHVALRNLGALLGQGPRLRFVRVSGERAHPEASV